MPRAIAVLVAVWAVAFSAATAHAALITPSGSFGSGARPTGFDDAESIAVDDAGRVYVADAGAGRVEVFDSATAGNRYLLSIGEGRLVRPVAVAVDNRQRVYVADTGRNVVELYDSASRRFAPRGVLGGPGQALGQFDHPAGLTTDPTQRLFVTERGNLRVSVFRPARRGGIVFQSAFGIGLPEPFLRPGATARDSDGRLYIANSDADGGIRAFDRRGRFISAVGGVVPKSPRGVAVDRFDRIVVSDTGNARLLVYGPLQRGAPHVETYTAEGLETPGPVAFAPGALVYVLSRGRVVRLRFDDADVDGVADAGDNCLGLLNPTQANADDDARGDACDDDDDGDGKLDPDDRCPTESAPARDPDGCRDPLSRFLVPTQNRRYPTSPHRLTGRSEGGALGIERVEVAIGRRLGTQAFGSSGAQCAWLEPAARRFTTRSCSRPIWFGVAGRDTWRIRLSTGFLRPGRYVAVARARQRQGPLEARLAVGRNVRLFSVG